jgi:hypothetical protein
MGFGGEKAQVLACLFVFSGAKQAADQGEVLGRRPAFSVEVAGTRTRGVSCSAEAHVSAIMSTLPAMRVGGRGNRWDPLARLAQSPDRGRFRISVVCLLGEREVERFARHPPSVQASCPRAA